jgi:peroxiredoxin
MPISSTMLELGTPAPSFALPDTDGRLVSLSDYVGAPAYVVMFICNHCPYVKHVAETLAQIGHDYQQRGVAVIAINSNDATQYPDDSPEQMKIEKQRRGYTFPYLYDATQQVAKAYRAACTPDFFVFDSDQRLVYRGQFDDSRPNRGEATGQDVRTALDALLTGTPVPATQHPSAGCSIKWKPGNHPDYA